MCDFQFFGGQIWKNVWWQNLQNLMKFNSILIFSVKIFVFSLTKFWKMIRFWQNRYFSITKFCFELSNFVWRVTKVLASFSRPNDCHTLSNFTIRKISLSWYDFVKESSPNSSYRSPKRPNEIVTKNFVKFSRVSF